MVQTYDPDEMARLDVLHADDFARNQGWDKHSYLQEPADDLASFFGYLPGRHVLDADCGWGRYVYRFLDLDLVYTGLDHSSEMLKVAQETNPTTTFKQGSVRDMPFSNDSFDGIWSCCVLPAIPKHTLVEVLVEHLRVLRPGGVLYLVMPLSPHYPMSREVLYDDDDGVPIIYQAYYTTDELTEYLAEAGFTVLNIDYRFDNGSLYAVVEKPQ